MLESFSKYSVYTKFRQEAVTGLAYALEAFLCTTSKVALLIAAIIVAVSFVRSFFPPEKTRHIHSHKTYFIGIILAAFPLVVITPFCPCADLIGRDALSSTFRYKSGRYDAHCCWRCP